MISRQSCYCYLYFIEEETALERLTNLARVTQPVSRALSGWSSQVTVELLWGQREANESASESIPSGEHLSPAKWIE